MLSQAEMRELVIEEGARRYPGVDITEIAAQGFRAVARARRRSLSAEERSEAVEMAVLCATIVGDLAMDVHAKHLADLEARVATRNVRKSAN